jgi:hypothetical protein
MTNKKITQLTSASAAASADVIPIVQNTTLTPDTKQISLTTLLANIPATGLTLGGDTNLYRSGVNQIKTDDNLAVGGGLVIVGDTQFWTAGEKLLFGDGAGAYDTNLYRTSASSLKTDVYFTSQQGLITAGHMSLSGSTMLTIAGDIVTITKAFHSLETEAGAASDNLYTIYGGLPGDILILKPVNASHVVTMKDGGGNLALNGDYVMSSLNHTITLLYSGTTWMELARSANG